VVKGAVAPLVIRQASADPRFRDHAALHVHGIESYIAVPLRRVDGSHFGTLCALDPLPADLHDADLEVFTLLAELVAYVMEEEDRRRQREAEMRALEDFTAIAAHDLRQPLTLLYGRAQMLARQARAGAAPETLAGGVESLLGQTRRAVLLSELLLDTARIEMDALVLEKGPSDLVALAREALEDTAGAAPQHDLRYIGPDAAPLVADGRRLAQVLRNLLDNAVKYSPERRGPIELSIAAPEDGGPLTLTVADSGIGVAEEARGQLFTRHYRAPEALGRNISGSGLGLFIARRIVEAHGGRIWAGASATGGLAVHLELPRG
jgi:signal transduction histidine kinase